MQYSILSQMNPFVKRKKEKFEKIFALKHQPKGLAAQKQNAAHQKRLVVFIVGETKLRIRQKHCADLASHRGSKNGLPFFDVGETIPRINRRLDADLVTLSIPTLRVGRAERSRCVRLSP